MGRFRKILTTSKNILRPQDSFAYIAFGISLLVLITKVTGLVKLQVFAHIYGVKSVDYAIFNAANIIPEFIFLIVAIGGINAALIPVLTQTSVNEDSERLRRVFSSLVNFFFLFLLVVSILVFIFARQIVTPALKLNITNTETPIGPREIDLFVRLLRIIIVSPIILCISSIFSSILQIKKRFFITQLSPLFYNFGVIFMALVFVDDQTKSVEPLAWGVVVGSALHFLVQLPAILRSEINYSMFVLDFKDFYVIKALRQALPRTIGLTSDYIGNIFQTLIALRLSDRALNSFRNTLSIRDIPITMFGVAISTALFPTLSELNKNSQRDEFQKIFSKGLRTILFWTLPSSILIIVLRTPIIRLVYSVFNSSITLSDVSLMSYILLFLSLGIVFYSVLNLVNRAYYALDDSKTPTFVSITVIFLELALTYGLVNLFSHFNNLSLNPVSFFKNVDDYFTNGGSDAAVGGIGFASSISIFINLFILCLLLRKKGLYFFYEKKHILKKVFSSAMMLIVGVFSLKVFEDFFNEERVAGILLLTINVFVFMVGTFYFSEKLVQDEDISILDKPITKVKKAFGQFKRLISKNKISGVGA